MMTTTHESLIIKAGAASDQGGPSMLRMKRRGRRLVHRHHNGNGSWYSLSIPSESMN